jgi:hypothetical protein
MKKMPSSLLVKLLSFFLVVQMIYSGGMAFAAENRNIVPVVQLLLADRDSAVTELKDDVVVIASDNVDTVASVSIDEVSGTTLLQVQDGLATLQPDAIIYIIPGADERFPFGLAGRVESVTSNGDGTTTVKLLPATFADVIKDAQIDMTDIPLDADNLIGIIAPAAVQPSESALAMAKSGLGKNDISFRNGAIVVRKDVNNVGFSPVPKDITSVGTVSLNVKVKLIDMGVDASKMKPYSAGTEASLLVSGSLDDIKLTHVIDFSGLSLDKFDVRVNGQLNAKMAFNVEGEATFGYFSKAWEDVEDEHFKLLGVKGKLEGMSTDDKKGKYPIAGLVWSIECPNPAKCLVLPGQTKTPLSRAKPLGVIVWVYADLEGTISVDGSFTPVSINGGKLELGLKKEKGGEFDVSTSLTRTAASSPRLIEVLGFDGTVGVEVFGGITTDLDVFTGGIYVANVGMDAGFQGSAGVLGKTSYGSNTLRDWSWEGEICRDASTIGAGAVFRATVDFGVEVNTSWKRLSGDTGFKYNWQLPSDEDMEKIGQHGLWWTAIWEREACAEKDCNGDLGGTAYVDYCGTCVGGKTGKTACVLDCNGDPGGTAYKDNCDICVGGNTGKTACSADCNGVSGGTAVLDNCGICVGGNTGRVSVCRMLPDTGQTGDYTVTFGEDSDYTINPPSYTDNHDGTVTDNITGLMWQQGNADGGATYNWYQATGVYDATSNPSTQNVCKAQTTGGHSDWRLPTQKELMGIVDYGRFNPSIDTTKFTGTIATEYWSSTTYAGISSYAWIVVFNFGYVNANTKSDGNYVRCVCGGQ